MQIEILKSKIHRVKVTGADLNYIGSITIDRALLEAANLVPGEKVQIVNINNGERLETYVIEGEENSGEITLNGPAARKVQKGDIIIGMEGNPLRISSEHFNMHVKLNYKVGDKLPLTLLRKGKRIHFDWPLTDRD